MDIKKKWGLFLLFNLALWSVIPLLRLSLPMDTQEAIVWGKYSLLGTTKHPPFSGIIAYYFYLLFGRTDGVMYLLSQIFVVLGLVYIYRLAVFFVGKTKAVLASMLQFGVIYYNFSSVEYNVNVISLALWPMCAYYFWRAYQENKWKDWLLFGILCGVNLLNKYTAALQIVSVGVFILTTEKGRRLFVNGRAYSAVLCAAAVLLPHIWWLAEHNFEMLNYILLRNSSTKIMASEWRHVLYPLKFAGGQLLFAAAAVLSYTGFYRFSEKNVKPDLKKAESKFLLICGLLPLAVFMTISLIAGTPLKSMWGFPCLFLTGISLLYFWPVKADEAKITRYSAVMAVWSLVFAAAYGIQCLVTSSERFRTDCPVMVQMLEQKWKDYTGGKELAYVGADVWFADMLALYGTTEIRPMVWLSPESNPWFDAEDFARKGALVVTSNYAEYMKYKNRYQDKLTDPKNIKIAYTSFFGRIKTRDMFYGFYNVKEVPHD